MLLRAAIASAPPHNSLSRRSKGSRVEKFGDIGEKGNVVRVVPLEP
jgi:hypothetical protein